MKKVAFKGWKNCIELVSGDFKIIVTTDVGPRVIAGFAGKNKHNIFCVKEDTAGTSGAKDWQIYGGHRLWHAPETKERTYAPDNVKIEAKELKNGGVCFINKKEETTGISKSVTISPLGKNKFRVEHKLRNENVWDIEVAAWALSVMAPGGTGIIPLPQGDKKALLPNRYMTIWPYTNMADERFTWGENFILVNQPGGSGKPAKIGLNCEDGCIAYVNSGTAFVKKFEHFIDAEYPDNGCSIECYTCNFMQEIETLSPLYVLAPGEEIIHVEEWLAVDGVKPVKNEKDAAKAIALK